MPLFPTITKRSVVKRGLGCARTFLGALILIPLLVCGLGYVGYNYFVNRNPPAQATAMANDFMNALVKHNYDEAYNDLGSAITGSTSHDDFIRQARTEDSCYGPVTSYQDAGTSSPNGTQVHTYDVSRANIGQPYHLHITLAKDFWGNWHITDYNSDAEVGQKTC